MFNRSLNSATTLALLLNFASATAQAVELQRVFTKDCDGVAGVAIGVDDTSVRFLDLDGRQTTLSIDQITFLATYNVSENPFSRLVVGPSDDAPLEVTTKDGDFVAFATNFIEDLVLFFDVDGQVRVVERDHVVAIRRNLLTATYSPRFSKSLTLASPPGRSACPTASNRKESVRPQSATRVFADKLKITEYFSHLRKGYRELESLRERTLFYPRPMAFDTTSRIGIVGPQVPALYELRPGRESGFPIYFETGSGTPYRFQSHFIAGNVQSSLTPQFDSFFGVHSEFKSHLIHGSFVGNLAGLAAGKSVTMERWTPGAREAPWSFQSFNHITVLGADYQGFGVSYGYYFPTFSFGAGDEFREVFAPNASWILAASYTQSLWKTEAIFYWTNVVSDVGDTLSKRTPISKDDDVVVWSSRRYVLHDVRLKSLTARLNWEFLPAKGYILGAAFYGSKTDYSETSLSRTKLLPAGGILDKNDQGKDPAYEQGPDVDNAFTARGIGAMISARVDLGQWIAIRAVSTIDEVDNSVSLPAQEIKESAHDHIIRYFGALEFVL